MSWPGKHKRVADRFLVQLVRARTVHNDSLWFLRWRGCYIIHVSFGGNPRERDMYLLRFVYIFFCIGEAN